MTLQFAPTLLDKPEYAGLKAHRKKVADIPEIAKWLKNRPVTDY
jgi:hypothetical protein